MLVPEVDLDFPRVFVEFPDPDDADQVFRCDLTWLTSRYRCTFGDGCPGIYADSPQVGCCALGAHFSERADEDRVAHFVAQLGPDRWQHRPDGRVRRRHWVDRDDEGVRKTQTIIIDGESACIFHNREGFSGGAGCALHALALDRQLHPLQTKPDVCWQLPIRRSYRDVTRPDGTTYTEVTIAEYDRRGWGAGGHDLDWYCSGNTDNHDAPEPVFMTNAAELIELMGEAAYQELARHCRARIVPGGQLPGRHPADPN